MDEDSSIAKIQQIFSSKSDLVDRFASLWNEYGTIPKDYGSGIFLTQVESHTLKSIADNPGITVTELASSGRRTKGAVSQVVKKLEQRKYIRRERCPVDGKRALLHVSEEGGRLSLLYRKYSVNDLRTTLDALLERCDVADVDTFFKVLDAYIGILESEMKKP